MSKSRVQVLGFRSGTGWKKAAAVLYFIFLGIFLSMSIVVVAAGINLYTPMDQFIQFVDYFLIFLALSWPVFLISLLSTLQVKMNTASRAALVILSTILIFCIAGAAGRALYSGFSDRHRAALSQDASPQETTAGNIRTEPSSSGAGEISAVAPEPAAEGSSAI